MATLPTSQPACLSDRPFLKWSLQTGTLPGQKGDYNIWQLMHFCESCVTLHGNKVFQGGQNRIKLGSTLTELLGTLPFALILTIYHHHPHHPHLLSNYARHFIRIFLFFLTLCEVDSIVVPRDRREKTQVKRICKLVCNSNLDLFQSKAKPRPTLSTTTTTRSGKEKKDSGQHLITLEKSYIHDPYKSRNIANRIFILLSGDCRGSDLWL